MADRKPNLKLMTNIGYDLVVDGNHFGGKSEHGEWFCWPFRVAGSETVVGADNKTFPPGAEGVFFTTPMVHELLTRGGAHNNAPIHLLKQQQGDKTPIRVWVNGTEVVGGAPAANPIQPATTPPYETTSPEPPHTASQDHPPGGDSPAPDPYLPLARIAARRLIAQRIGEGINGQDVRGETVTSICMALERIDIPTEWINEGFVLLTQTGVLKDQKPELEGAEYLDAPKLPAQDLTDTIKDIPF